MGYIAGKRLDMGTSWREPGDPVPEAEGWTNLRSYLGNGSVIFVEEEEETTSLLVEPPVELVFVDVDFGSMTKAELKAAALELGLDTGGTKQELFERLTA